MLRHLVLSSRAQADLKNIYAYTLESWGRAQAQQYLDRIEHAFAQLIDNSKLGKERPDVKPGYRSLVIEKHVIFYTLRDDAICILGVVHGRMDVVNYLL